MNRSANFVIVVSIIAALTAALPALAQDKPILAVMEIEDKTGKFEGKDQEAATDYLSTLLVTSGKYSVVEKGRQEEKRKQVVKDLKRETHDACYDDKCKIELGRELAADTLVSCTLSKLGDDCMLNCRMIPLERAVADKAGVAKFICDSNGLSKGVDQVIAQLLEAGVPLQAEVERKTEPDKKPEPENFSVPPIEPTWTDPTASLTWQVTPTGGTMKWSKAKVHCAGLDLGSHTDWRLPTIGELRSLIRGCSKTETGGSCNIKAGRCLRWSCRHNSCNGCSNKGGPGAGGMYWPDEIQGDCCWYWSSSAVADSDASAWCVDFNGALVDSARFLFYKLIRCVRDAP